MRQLRLTLHRFFYHRRAMSLSEMTREICKMCGRESAVGFTVPDAIWNQVAERLAVALDDVVLCLGCFTRIADRLSIEWDKDIQFWPVSMVTLNANDPAASYRGSTGSRAAGYMPRKEDCGCQPGHMPGD